MTDEGTSYDGWDIAAVSVDGVDVALTDLTTQVAPEADFLVTLVADNAAGWMIIDIPSLDLDETAQKLFPVGGYDELYVIVIRRYKAPSITSVGHNLPRTGHRNELQTPNKPFSPFSFYNP